jgi:alpha-L-rhamnosidase
MAECAWQLDGNRIMVPAIVPPNTSAIVTLPGSDQVPFHVGSGRHCWLVHFQRNAR